VIGILGRALRAGGRFLWSFFVDDTPEVLVVVAVIVAGAYALRGHDALAVAVLPLVASAGLALCVWRAVRDRSAAPGPAGSDTADPSRGRPNVPDRNPPLSG